MTKDRNRSPQRGRSLTAAPAPGAVPPAEPAAAGLLQWRSVARDTIESGYRSNVRMASIVGNVPGTNGKWTVVQLDLPGADRHVPRAEHDTPAAARAAAERAVTDWFDRVGATLHDDGQARGRRRDALLRAAEDIAQEAGQDAAFVVWLRQRADQYVEAGAGAGGAR